MDTLGYGLLGALGVGTYFGVKSLTRPHYSDQESVQRATQRFNSILGDTLSMPGLALANNFNDPVTAAFLNSSQGLDILGNIYAGQLRNSDGDRFTQQNRQWLTAAAARNDQSALALLRPVQYAYGTANYQPFGNYPSYDYGYGYGNSSPYGFGNSFGNQNYGYGNSSPYGFGNSFGNQNLGYGYNDPSAYLNNNSFYNSFPNFTGQNQYLTGQGPYTYYR